MLTIFEDDVVFTAISADARCRRRFSSLQCHAIDHQLIFSHSIEHM